MPAWSYVTPSVTHIHHSCFPNTFARKKRGQMNGQGWAEMNMGQRERETEGGTPGLKQGGGGVTSGTRK